MSRKIKCAHCGKETTYGSDNEFRPFCSKRCQLIDLGEWADGKYAIPSEEMVSPENVNDESGDDDPILH